MNENSIVTHRYNLGIIASWAVFILGFIYLITTVLGLLSLESSQDAIGDPYFTMMELLIILLSPCIVVGMIAVHDFASLENKKFSLAALIFIAISACITTCVHFVVLTVSRQIDAAGFASSSLLFSFYWPSVAYALDILAWDIFFALSMLFAAAVFGKSRLEKTIRSLMIISGVLCLSGLLGVPLANMNIRNIGIIGYALLSPVIFLLLAIFFGRLEKNP